MKFQVIDQRAQQHFLTYLNNISSIDVVDGEEILTAFEYLTSRFDDHLQNFLDVHLWLERSLQVYHKRVLQKSVTDAKLKHECVTASSSLHRETEKDEIISKSVKALESLKKLHEGVCVIQIEQSGLQDGYLRLKYEFKPGKQISFLLQVEGQDEQEHDILIR